MTKQNYHIVMLLAIGVIALVLCIWGITARINGLQERVSNDEGVVERLNMGLSRVEGQLDTLITTPPSTDDDSYEGSAPTGISGPYSTYDAEVAGQGDPCAVGIGPCCASYDGHQWTVRKGPCSSGIPSTVPPYTDAGPQRLIPPGEPCPDTYTGPCCAERDGKNNWIVTKGPCDSGMVLNMPVPQGSPSPYEVYPGSASTVPHCIGNATVIDGVCK